MIMINFWVVIKIDLPLQVVPEQESLPASPVHHKGSLPNILEEETRVVEEVKV